MAAEITVPALGESIIEATVGHWLKREGDPVEEGETLVELETDKVNVEVSAGQSGVLERILQPEGATVAIGDVLAVIGAGEGAPSMPVAAAPEAGRTPSAPLPVALPPVAAAPAPAQPPLSAPISAQEEGPTVRAPALISPVALRVAQEHGLDVSAIRGTGLNGRVTKDDVEAYLKAHEQPASATAAPLSPPMRTDLRPESVAPRAAPPTLAPLPPVPSPSNGAGPGAIADGRREERVRLSRRRQTIARRLVEAQHTAAMLTTFNEVDMSAILALRAKRREAFKERHGVGLGFMSFFTKAVIGGLKAYPRLNAEIQGDEMILKHYYDIGIAVSTDEGLVVPVLRDADRLTFAEIERHIADLAKKARERRLSLEDLQGGTFTITNGGVFGSLLSTPILNGPQVGILGMHKIEERPIALNGQVVIHPMMYLAVSYDHRIVDGAEAVSFLVRVKELLEDPETLLLEG
jgi:2-oxoglutarate dehydrogenase E2 component (dihydrolipoamide succinyltransferase)